MDLLLKSSRVVKEQAERHSATIPNPLGGLGWGGTTPAAADPSAGPSADAASPSSRDALSLSSPIGKSLSPGNELSGRMGRSRSAFSLVNSSFNPSPKDMTRTPTAAKDMTLPFEPLAFFAFGSPIGLFRVISEVPNAIIQHF